MLIVKKAARGGAARRAGVRKGDALLSLGGYPVLDILDYLFYDAERAFPLVFSRGGKEYSARVEKEEGESLGLTFVSDGLEIRTCRNRCKFCFVDQMPTGLRDTLYVKDDDYRQSFLSGTFVTLTNLTEEDAARIVRLRLSPLYVSVHAVTPEVRCALTGNRFAGKIAEYLDRFRAAGIEMHAQAVIVPGVNDGEELRRTARRLFALRPEMKTLAAVPCGITKYRDGLEKIPDIDRDYARRVLDEIDALNAEFGENFVEPADEFFLRADRPLPPPEFYGAFEQVENGVGMTAKFVAEARAAFGPRRLSRATRFLLVTGTSARDTVAGLAAEAAERVENASAKTVAAINNFFGETVTCTGLLTGGDVAAAAEAEGDWDVLVLPSSVLRRGEAVFLDGMTAEELAARLGRRVRFTDGTGGSFFDALSLDVFPAEYAPRGAKRRR